jgi:nucleotide-binding universal stress UspA family protein
MNPSNQKSLHREFHVFHPSDFSMASEIAFAHALKIALRAHAQLDIMHVEPHPGIETSCWIDFPAVRTTLTRWGILPEGVGREAVARAGLHIRKVLACSKDPVGRMLRHFRTFPPDLIVLATHQRDGVDRWLHKAVAEPVARRSGAMTLFVARRGGGFVSRSDGTASLKKILIPVDSRPHPQVAVEKALSLARGLECYTGEFRLLHVGNRSTTPMLDLPLGYGWSYESRETDGDVVNEILKAEEDWQPDLMVLATAGHLDFVDALRGSTTERVLRLAHCPVLAVPERSAAKMISEAKAQAPAEGII